AAGATNYHRQPSMTLVNAWTCEVGGVAERRAFVQCDGCFPPNWISGNARYIASQRWRFDALEGDVHHCPRCRRTGQAWRRYTPAPRPGMPPFLVIGAAKAGTSSLHAYLDLHPEIAMSEAKELNLFQDPRYERKLDTYATCFDGAVKERG